MISINLLNQYKLLRLKTTQKKLFNSRLNIEKKLAITKKIKSHNYFTLLFYKAEILERSHDKRTICFNISSLLFSFLGSVETMYLTINKLNGFFSMCSSQNCTMVLDSVFSNLIGIPISMIGASLYVLVFILLSKKLICYYSKNSDKLIEFSIITFQFLLSFFSLYFFLILKFFLQTNCPWCAFSIFITSLLLFFGTISKNGSKIINLNYISCLIVGLSVTLYCLFLLNILEIIST